MKPGFSFQICKFYIKMFINHSWFSSWFNLSTSCNRSPRNPNSLCIANQLCNPAAPSKQNLITNGLDWKLSPGTGSRNYALRENGYCGCHQSKSRTLCTGSRTTCTPCSLRRFWPPRTGESWNTSLTRWCRMSVLTLIVNKVNIIPMTIGIKMKLRVVTCSRQQSWSGLVWTSWYWMGGCNRSIHLLFNLGDCFLNLKLNSHIGSCLFPTIFLHQKSKHLEFFSVLGVLSGMAGFLEIRAANGSYIWYRDRITHARRQRSFSMDSGRRRKGREASSV